MPGMARAFRPDPLTQEQAREVIWNEPRFPDQRLYSLKAGGDFAHAGGLGAGVGVQHTGWPQQPAFSSCKASRQPQQRAARSVQGWEQPQPRTTAGPEHSSEVQPEQSVPTGLLLQPCVSVLHSCTGFLSGPALLQPAKAAARRAFPWGNVLQRGKN